MFIHADGWDHFGTGLTQAQTEALMLADNYIQAHGGAVLASFNPGSGNILPPNGIGMLQVQAYQSQFKRVVNSNNPQSTQFRMNWASGLPGTDGWGFSFMDAGSTEFLRIFFRSNGQMTVSTSTVFGNVGNYLGSTAQVMRSSMWQHWQFVFIPNTNGSPPYNAQVYIFLEGILQLGIQGINLNNNVGFHFLGWNAIVGGTPNVLIKDWIIADTANGLTIPTPPLQTDMRIINGNGANNAWTPQGVANNWQGVAKNNPDTSTYTHADTAGLLQDFTVPASIAPISNVKSVLLKAYMQKSSAGVAQAQIGCNSGSTTLQSAAMPIGTSFAYYQQFFDNDPNTIAPWLAAAYNALGCRLNRNV